MVPSRRIRSARRGRYAAFPRGETPVRGIDPEGGYQRLRVQSAKERDEVADLFLVIQEPPERSPSWGRQRVGRRPVSQVTAGTSTGTVNVA